MSRLCTTAVMLMVFSGVVLGMGKSEGSKKKVEKPLIKKEEVKAEAPKVAAEPVKEEVKAPVEKKEVKVEAVKPVEKPKEAEVVAEPAASAGSDKAVVTINGTAITDKQVNAKIDEAMKMQLSRMGPAAEKLPPDAMKSLRDRMRQDVLTGMVLEFLVDAKLKAMKIAITDEEIGGKLDEIMKLNKITLDDIKAELAKNGVTLDDFKVQLKRNLGIERLIDGEMKTAGVSSEISDEDAQKYYDENKAQFSREEQVRASHILIKTDGLDDAGKAAAKAKIEDLLKRARGGEDFAELAKEYSEDPGSKAQGGEYVFGRGRMVKEFEDAAFSLEDGKTSDVVQTQYGYHIIKLSERIPAETKSFADVKDDLKKNLSSRKKGEFWNVLREKLQSEAKIEWSAEEQARRAKAMPAGPKVIQPAQEN